jgi:hypothetical protein
MNTVLEKMGKEKVVVWFKQLLRHLPGGIGENHEKFCQNIRSLGLYLKPGSPKYESGVLSTWQQHSVNKNIITFKKTYNLHYLLVTKFVWKKTKSQNRK